MKVWSKTLTPADLQEAARQVNHEFPGCQVFLGEGSNDEGPSLYEGPRTRRIDNVHLRSGTSRRYPNGGSYGALHTYGMAASWTEWGWFIARVFERDPHARCGDYHGRADFDKQTDGRFIEPRSPRERQVKRALRAVS